MFDGAATRRFGADYFLRLRSRGLLGAARRSRDVHDFSIHTIVALERAARSGGPLLRLPPEVETEYRREWRITANYVRVLLCMLPIVVFFAFPVWAEALLGMPPSIGELMRTIYLHIIVPVALATALIAWSLPQSPVSGTALAIAGLVLVVTLEVVRRECAALGYPFDHAVATCVPVGLAVLGGFRFDRVIGLIVGYVATVLATAAALDTPARLPTEWISEGVLLFIAALAALWMETTQRRGWAARRLLQLQAHQDGLTGLRNRRSFELHYEVVAAQARRDGRPLLFALMDLDYFKRVNDRYGHEYGDGALSEIAVALSQYLRRPLDAVARLGGEEFALLLYDCAPDNARERLDELVNRVRALGIENEDAPLRVLTISAGGVVADGSLPMSELYHSADRHLYEAKRRGRDGAHVGPMLRA